MTLARPQIVQNVLDAVSYIPYCLFIDPRAPMENMLDDWSALYPEFKTVTLGGIEMRLSHRVRLPDLPPMTADEIRGHSGPPSPPRPTVTAWKGADIDAYYFADDDLWRHCRTGAVWAGHNIEEQAA